MNFYQTSNLVNEALSGPFSQNFQYRIPQDFEVLIADFYALTALANQLRNMSDPSEPDLAAHNALRLFLNIKKAHKDITDYLKSYLLKAIPYICSVEMRHFHSQASEYLRNNRNSNVLSKVEKLFDYIDRLGMQADYVTKAHSPEHPNHPDHPNNPDLVSSQDFLNQEKESYKKKTHRNVKVQINWYKLFIHYFGSVESFMQFCVWAFSLPQSPSARRKSEVWENLYGGNAWAEIAKYYFKIKEVKEDDTNQLTHIIDLFIDLEHNTGSALNKVNHLYKTGDHDFEWLKNFLDVRAKMPTPYGYFDVLSSQTQSLVAAFYKAKHGLSYEMYQKLMRYHAHQVYANRNYPYDDYDLGYRGTANFSGRTKHSPYKFDKETINHYKKYRHFLMLPHDEILNV